MNPTLFIGPVSKNTVDASIEFSNENYISLGLIPSRRQVDYDGGYVNGWTTKTLSEYVKNHGGHSIILQRDHGGIGQGKDNKDDDYLSFAVDSLYLDLIHIDPFQSMNIFDGIDYTIHWIQKLGNPKLRFEVGTESTIKRFAPHEFDLLLRRIKEHGFIHRVKYAVIQSGTSLLENTNTGRYDEIMLTEMVRICQKYGVYSKEHNGDYLPTELIKKKFSLGLNAINIAPEFGMLESICYIDAIKQNNPSLLDEFYNICYQSGKWQKWIGRDFDKTDKEKLIKICGHYVLSTNQFVERISNNLPNIDYVIKKVIKKRIKELC